MLRLSQLPTDSPLRPARRLQRYPPNSRYRPLRGKRVFSGSASSSALQSPPQQPDFTAMRTAPILHSNVTTTPWNLIPVFSNVTSTDSPDDPTSSIITIPLST
eukprot:Filipodium_phascolosomae@DN4582_c0_g1_i1.p1